MAFKDPILMSFLMYFPVLLLTFVNVSMGNTGMTQPMWDYSQGFKKYVSVAFSSPTMMWFWFIVLAVYTSNIDIFLSKNNVDWKEKIPLYFEIMILLFILITYISQVLKEDTSKPKKWVLIAILLLYVFKNIISHHTYKTCKDDGSDEGDLKSSLLYDKSTVSRDLAKLWKSIYPLVLLSVIYIIIGLNSKGGGISMNIFTGLQGFGSNLLMVSFIIFLAVIFTIYLIPFGKDEGWRDWGKNFAFNFNPLQGFMDRGGSNDGSSNDGSSNDGTSTADSTQ